MALSGPRRQPPPTLFAVIGTLVALGFGVAAYQVWSNDNALRERGQQVSARVVEVSTGKASRVHVEFDTADGRQVRAMVGQGDEAPGPRAKAGDEIPIVYDPRNPTADVRDARASDNHTVAYLLLGVTVLAAGSVALAILALIRRKAKAP